MYLNIKLNEYKPAKRFNGKMIKHHKFFTNINWSALENKLIEPPIKLMTFNDDDTQYFNLVIKKIKLKNKFIF